ncbi:site-specific DNA-methyltransferase, partial [Xanthomonas arboricola pv. corylina]
MLPTLEANSFDALITDPPYASGGLTAAATSPR